MEHFESSIPHSRNITISTFLLYKETEGDNVKLGHSL